MRCFRPGGRRGCALFIQVSVGPGAAFVPHQLPDRACFLSLSYCLEPQRWAWLHKSGGNATSASPSCQLPVLQFFFSPRLCERLSGVPSVRSGVMSLCICFRRKDDKDYALKQIEGTGISMSACREIAVRTVLVQSVPPTPPSLFKTVQVSSCNVKITFPLRLLQYDVWLQNRMCY